MCGGDETWWHLSLDALFQGLASLAAVVGAFAVAGYQIRKAFETSKKAAIWQRGIELRDALIPLLDLARLAKGETKAVADALRPDLAVENSPPAHANVFAQFNKYDDLLMKHWDDLHRSENEKLEESFLKLRANLGFLRHGLTGYRLAQQIAKLDEVSGMADTFIAEFDTAFPKK